MNLQKTAQGYNFKTVAEWHFDKNHSDIAKNFHWTSKIIWNSGQSNPPESVCSRNCSPGKRLQYQILADATRFCAVKIYDRKAIFKSKTKTRK